MSENMFVEGRTYTEIEEIFSAAMDIGERMLACGAEVNRVEETVSRICRAYGAETVVFSITSLIIATLRVSGKSSMTQTRRASYRSTDLCRLEDLNALSRHICENTPPPDVIRGKISELENSVRPRKRLCSLLGYVLSAGSFALFFGGGIAEGIAAAAVSMIILLLDRYAKPSSPNQLVYTLMCSAAAGAAALICGALFQVDTDKVIIGDIMVLIPGLGIMNSIRDMFCGDIVTGLLRLSEAVLTSAVIAIGFAIPAVIFGV